MHIVIRKYENANMTVAHKCRQTQRRETYISFAETGKWKSSSKEGGW